MTATSVLNATSNVMSLSMAALLSPKPKSNATRSRDATMSNSSRNNSRNKASNKLSPSPRTVTSTPTSSSFTRSLSFGRNASFRRSSSSRSFNLEMDRHPSELDVAAFEDFMCRKLPSHVHDDEDLLQSVIKGAKDLLSHSELQDSQALLSKNSDHSHSNQAPSLQDLEVGLMSILDYTPTLPSNIVAQLHSYRGLLFEKLQDPVNASDCFMRALWIQTHSFRSNHKIQNEDHTTANTTAGTGTSHENNYSEAAMAAYLEIATTEHRLGVALGKAKQFQKAMDQIQHALVSYQKANGGQISGGNYGARMVMAKEDLHDVVEEQQLDMLRKSPSRACSIVRPELSRSRSMVDRQRFAIRKPGTATTAAAAASNASSTATMRSTPAVSKSLTLSSASVHTPTSHNMRHSTNSQRRAPRNFSNPKLDVMLAQLSYKDAPPLTRFDTR